jgi:hypothetical protein
MGIVATIIGTLLSIGAMVIGIIFCIFSQGLTAFQIIGVGIVIGGIIGFILTALVTKAS